MNPGTFFDKFGLLADTPNGVQKLRELILQLAVRGKLVPQDLNDEPAAVLLGEIKAEKERLVKEKKIRKSKPLPLVQVSEVPTDIPLNWEWTRIGEICQIVGGGTPKTNHAEYFAENGIHWLTPADLYRFEGKFINLGRRDISELGLQKSSAQLMPKGTVVFSSRAPIGYVAIAANDVATNQGFKSCVPFFMDMNEYIYYFLKSAGKEIDNNASGTTFKEVSGKIVSQIVFPLPPLQEQRRIVAKADQLMALCDELEARQQKKQETRLHLNSTALDRLLTAHEPDEFAHHWQRICDNFDMLYGAPETVGELRKAILQLAVQGKLVRQDSNDEPAAVLLERIKTEKERLVMEKKIKKVKQLPDFEDGELPYEIPNEWLWTRLDQIANSVHYGYTASANHELKDIRLLRITDIQNGRVNWDNVPGCEIDKKIVENYRLYEGDLLIARTGGTIGKSYLVEKPTLCAVFASYIIRVIPNSQLFPNYLKIFLGSPLYWKQLYEKSMGTGQPNVNGTSLRALILPLPPLQEQHRIVAKVDQLMALCDDLESKLKQSQTDGEKLMGAVVAELIGA